MLKVNHYQQLTKVLPTKLTIRPKLTTTISPPLYIHLPRDANMADDTEENRDTEGRKVYIYEKRAPDLEALW